MPTSQVEQEAANIVAPLVNTTAMRSQHVLRATPSGQSLDLTQVFGNFTDGHYISIQADGSRCYIAFSTNATPIDYTAVGTGATICWPVADGSVQSFRIPAGREQRASAGIATQCSYNVINYQAVATCYLRLYRSSLPSEKGSEMFPAP